MLALSFQTSVFLKNRYISNTTLSDSFINSIPNKLSYLSFRLIVIFALNALFYSDKYISLVFGFLGPGCCVWAFSGCGEQGLLLVLARGLLIAVAPLVVEHRL